MLKRLHRFAKYKDNICETNKEYKEGSSFDKASALCALLQLCGVPLQINSFEGRLWPVSQEALVHHSQPHTALG